MLYCLIPYLGFPLPSKFRFILATPSPCLFFAKALYSPLSEFSTPMISSRAMWYKVWSSSNVILYLLLSFINFLPWYLYQRVWVLMLLLHRSAVQLKCFRYPYHVMVGFGLPTHRHSNVILVPSSDCLMTGLSVNVGLIKSSGTGASSPSRRKSNIIILKNFITTRRFAAFTDLTLSILIINNFKMFSFSFVYYLNPQSNSNRVNNWGMQ